MTWDLIHPCEMKGMIWLISSASVSEILSDQAALETKKPLTKSKIRILKVVKGMIESKKTKDIDKDRVTQSSRANLVKVVETRL